MSARKAAPTRRRALSPTARQARQVAYGATDAAYEAGFNHGRMAEIAPPMCTAPALFRGTVFFASGELPSDRFASHPMAAHERGKGGDGGGGLALLAALAPAIGLLLEKLHIEITPPSDRADAPKPEPIQ